MPSSKSAPKTSAASPTTSDPGEAQLRRQAEAGRPAYLTEAGETSVRDGVGR